MAPSQIDAAWWLLLCEERCSVTTPVLMTLAAQHIVMVVRTEEDTGREWGPEGECTHFTWRTLNLKFLWRGQPI